MNWWLLLPATPPAWPSGSCSGPGSGCPRRCPCTATTCGSTRTPGVSVRLKAPGNKARRGREGPILADLLESLADLASFHPKDRSRPMLDISRQWVGENMKRAATAAGIDPARVYHHAFRHTYGRNCVLCGVPLPMLQQ